MPLVFSPRSPRPQRSALFPYTTLFRSERPSVPAIGPVAGGRDRAGLVVGSHQLAVDDEACAISDRKSTRLNSSHVAISYAVFCLKKKNPQTRPANYPVAPRYRALI